jgi:hypothetical protein
MTAATWIAETEAQFRERVANEIAGKIIDLDARAAALDRFLAALGRCNRVTAAWAEYTAACLGLDPEDWQCPALAELEE